MARAIALQRRDVGLRIGTGVEDNESEARS